MKILLVGEYSRLHNSLKEGLMALGHEVILISTGDFFKNYPSDIKLTRTYDSGIAKKLKVGIYKLFGIDITSESIKKQFFTHKEQLKDFDVVQLINESPLTTTPKIAIDIISFLKKYNTKLFLLSCGTDYISVSHALSDAHPYSILTNYKDGTYDTKRYKFILKNLEEAHKKLHDFVYSQIDGVIASDLDYHLPLLGHKKYLGLIPNPVNLSKLPFTETASEGPIVIFMGINRGNMHTKGIHYFEAALKNIQQEYSEAITIDIVENLPYSEYIEKYNKAHIVLDQVLAYDQGYNALEAMAKGKVVFTGAETAFSKHYKLDETVAINALPDVDYLTKTLANLIENPEKIKQIGAAARAFVEREHDHIKVAKQYLESWK
ncbi:glycosyltransferase [Jejudonia soesokkakensis]|uniref:Glycosyltransferase n=1 Tax=Jejudonia soesokkakensis TaxID=1323432 RepID=A0ABW2MRY5_9FLAO